MFSLLQWSWFISEKKCKSTGEQWHLKGSSRLLRDKTQGKKPQTENCNREIIRCLHCVPETLTSTTSPNKTTHVKGSLGHQSTRRWARQWWSESGNFRDPAILPCYWPLDQPRHAQTREGRWGTFTKWQRKPQRIRGTCIFAATREFRQAWFKICLLAQPIPQVFLPFSASVCCVMGPSLELIQRQEDSITGAPSLEGRWVPSFPHQHPTTTSGFDVPSIFPFLTTRLCKIRVLILGHPDDPFTTLYPHLIGSWVDLCRKWA